MTIVAILLALLVVDIEGCVFWNRIAVIAAPKKEAIVSRSHAALKADQVFWNVFHNGQYDKIQETLDALTAAYLQTPNDAITSAHIAWLHNWRVAEHARLISVPATITDDTAVARRYFQEAVKLNPSDARLVGFLAGHTIIEGAMHKDERLTRQGYFMMLDAINAWPEFNLFTGGYVMSRLPADSRRFREGLEWEWQALDACIEGTLDRVNPDYSPYMTKETTEGKERVCWNSWIAPHNLEGFFLNMGDMLVKTTDWQTAQKIYANAKLLKTYATWPYRSILEDRITRAKENVTLFNSSNAASPMMINSPFACMACHQR